MTITHRARVVIACGCLLVLIGCLAWLLTSSRDDNGWKRIEFKGVHASIPSNWRKVDMAHCDPLYFARWAPPGAEACSNTPSGLMFEGGAVIDSYIDCTNMHNFNGKWVGRADTRNFTVIAIDADRALAAKILRSTRPTLRCDVPPGGTRRYDG